MGFVIAQDENSMRAVEDCERALDDLQIKIRKEKV